MDNFHNIAFIQSLIIDSESNQYLICKTWVGYHYITMNNNFIILKQIGKAVQQCHILLTSIILVRSWPLTSVSLADNIRQAPAHNRLFDFFIKPWISKEFCYTNQWITVNHNCNIIVELPVPTWQVLKHNLVYIKCNIDIPTGAPSSQVLPYCIHLAVSKE